MMKTHRLFFALWPSVQVRQAIVENFSQALPTPPPTPPPLKIARPVPPHNLHVTLHFIGSVSADEKHCLHVAAQGLTEPAGVSHFDLNFNCYGHFPKAKIGWMGMQKIPIELMQLQQNLAVALSTCAYQPDKRVYRPHLSLMRKCIRPVVAQQAFSIRWQVDEFVLVESIPGESSVNYRVIERYPL